MKVNKRSLDEEKKYLDEVLGVIERRGGLAHGEMSARAKDVGALKKYVWEAQRDLDLVELTEHRRAATFQALRIEANHRLMTKLAAARKNPFFGRMDFAETNGDEETLYIGLMQIEEENQFYVYDWRAPISSMFYDFGLGPAHYEAPVGRIDGTITRRRQFKIVDGVMTRALDTDLNVADDFLQDMLSQSSSEKMRQVVTTIQHEQNTVIRNTEDRFLIVQGVAGSGKTSVALHRVAYLLYKEKGLRSDNVLIFSPNRVFSEYISDVLPDLGEENAPQTTFSDFARAYLAQGAVGVEGAEVESFTEFIERAYSTGSAADGTKWRVTEWKLSEGFRELVDQFVARTLAPARFNSGIFVKGREYDAKALTMKFRSAAGETLIDKAERLADILSDEAGIEYESARDDVFRELIEKVQRDYFLERIYGEFLKWAASSAPQGVDRGVIIWQAGGKIAYEDSVAMLYLRFKLFGFPRDESVLHVVIDEAQDYTLLQMEIIGRIFEKAAFTVLGDVNQTINPFYRHESLKQFSHAFRGRSRFVELKNAYRSTPEIVQFSNEILGIADVSSIRRGGGAPVLRRGPMEETEAREGAESREAKEGTEAKEGAESREADIVSMVGEDVRRMIADGLKSIAIITKTAEEAARLFERARAFLPELRHVESGSQTFSKKLVIMASYLSKGLEFDGVISYGGMGSRGSGYGEREKRLFYVVCRRAQHRLVVYEGVTHW